MPPAPEALARQQIDDKPVAAGWVIHDYKAVDFSAGRGNDFCKKINYQAKQPVTGKPAKSKELIKVSRPLRPTAIRRRRTYRVGAADTFCLSPSLRIAVTVDMISTSTDIKPLEVIIFLRDVRSHVYFEQMKGCGTRVLAQKPRPAPHSLPINALGWN